MWRELTIGLLVLAPVTGVIAYFLLGWLLRRGVSTPIWALVCFCAYMVCGFGSLLLYPDGRALFVTTLGGIVGGALAKSNYLLKKRKGRS